MLSVNDLMFAIKLKEFLHSKNIHVVDVLKPLGRARLIPEGDLYFLTNEQFSFLFDFLRSMDSAYVGTFTYGGVDYIIYKNLPPTHKTTP